MRRRSTSDLRLDCEGSVTITFLDAAGNPSRHLDEQTKLWFLRPDHGEWSVLVVEDA